MKYEDLRVQYEASGQTVSLMAMKHEWVEAGEVICGLCTKIETLKGKRGGTSYKMYSVETDKGLVKFSLGKGIDESIKEDMLLNKVIMITYLGKKDLSRGRKMNQFRIEDLTSFLPKEEADILPFTEGTKKAGKR